MMDKNYVNKKLMFHRFFRLHFLNYCVTLKSDKMRIGCLVLTRSNGKKGYLQC